MMDIFSCSVACGMGHSMVVVDRTNVGDRLDQVIIQKQHHSLLLRNLLVATASCSLVPSVPYDVQSLMAGSISLSNAIL